MHDLSCLSILILKEFSEKNLIILVRAFLWAN